LLGLLTDLGMYLGDVLDVSAMVLMGREWTQLQSSLRVQPKTANVVGWKDREFAELAPELVRQLNETGHKPAFVFIYRKSCTECTELMPEVEKI